MTPWTDRAGQYSALKMATLLATLAPGIWLAVALLQDRLGGKPVTAAIHETGDWAVRFLLASLAVTPLRRIARWSRLILERRMLGVAALGYAAAHLLLYVVDQSGDLVRVVSEIALRTYLTIGFVALLGLALLGITSTDATIRRLGRSWGRLHRCVYAIGVLTLVHYFLQSKLNTMQASFMAGLFVLLMTYRLADRFATTMAFRQLAVLAIAGGLATAAIEFAWVGLATNLPAVGILKANLDFSYQIRPAWWVLGCGLAFAALAALRAPATGSAASRLREPVAR